MVCMLKPVSDPAGLEKETEALMTKLGARGDEKSQLSEFLTEL